MTQRSRGPNPWTGLNNRGFPEGGYNNAAAYQQTRENLEALFEPTHFALTEMRFWRDAGNPGFAIVRLDISENGAQAERHLVHVPNQGFRAWGEKVYETLRAWVEAFLENNAPTTVVPTT